MVIESRSVEINHRLIATNTIKNWTQIIEYYCAIERETIRKRRFKVPFFSAKVRPYKVPSSAIQELIILSAGY